MVSTCPLRFLRLFAERLATIEFRVIFKLLYGEIQILKGVIYYEKANREMPN